MRLILAALLLMASSAAWAHEEETGLTLAQVFPIDPVLMVVYASIISGAAIATALIFMVVSPRIKERSYIGS